MVKQTGPVAVGGLGEFFDFFLQPFVFFFQVFPLVFFFLIFLLPIGEILLCLFLLSFKDGGCSTKLRELLTISVNHSEAKRETLSGVQIPREIKLVREQ